jgi:hypothetical protein
LFLLEVALLMIGLILFLIVNVPPSNRWGLLFQNVSGVIAWAGAPMVWIALFKPRQLQRVVLREPA